MPENGPDTGCSTSAPAVEIRPMARPASSLNQTPPSGPGVMSQGSTCTLGIGKSVIAPEGSTRPI